jgi:hypothetical protein
MKRNGWMNLVLGGVLVLSAGTAKAQGPGGGHPGPFGGPMELMGFEGMHGGKLVKGAPFSATTTSTTQQTLQDGSTINRTANGAVYRDSEGRSRREVTFTGVGPLATTGGSHKMVAILDPVAGAHYMLNPDKKDAHKMTLPAKGGAAETAGKAQAFEQKMQARQQQEEASGALKVESLGTQMVNGVNAQGTRTTHTIAAGEIGNSAAIQIVSERWYSPDLQTVVKSTRTDPRFGTTTFSLSNIQKAEPAATLFAVPADYTVKEGEPGHGHHHGGPGAPPPPGV